MAFTANGITYNTEFYSICSCRICYAVKCVNRFMRVDINLSYFNCKTIDLRNI